MATIAAIRAASSTILVCSFSTASTSSHSDCRNGHGPVVTLVCSSTTSLPSASASLSSSRCYVPFQSGFQQLRVVRAQGRQGAARGSPASTSPRCESESKAEDEKIPFGYTRKDVILIGVGLLGFGIALKFGLELFGVDSIKAGNAVQLIMVLGLTIGWISTYVFRVSSKEMTYAKQLKEYENKVIEKRLEEMPEAELESMLAQIEEDKRRLKESRDGFL